MTTLACPACGFDGRTVEPAATPGLMTAASAAMAAELRERPAGLLRARPAPDRWSALEYACHVRDVLLVQRDRLYRALVEDCPDCVPMHRDERAALSRYRRQDPVRVAVQLDVAAELAADAFGALGPADWDRRLLYHWPATHQLDVAGLARHTAHEAAHHLLDLRAATGAARPATR